MIFRITIPDLEEWTYAAFSWDYVQETISEQWANKNEFIVFTAENYSSSIDSGYGDYTIPASIKIEIPKRHIQPVGSTLSDWKLFPNTKPQTRGRYLVTQHSSSPRSQYWVSFGSWNGSDWDGNGIIQGAEIVAYQDVPKAYPSSCR